MRISYTSGSGLDASDVGRLVSPGELLEGGSNDAQREKVRPEKSMNSLPKGHWGNKTPKPRVQPHDYSGVSVGRVFRKVDALQDAQEHVDTTLSKSLLDLLPSHVNNTNSAIRTAIRSADGEIFYSFDNKGKSPGQKGREVDLGGLVEQAEKKFMSEQTERIVKGEYEVIDGEGETTILPGKKAKKGSPKQRAVKTEASVVASKLEDDDGFELV